MRIRTRIHLNTGIIAVLMGIAALSLFWAFREAVKADRNENLAVEMEKTAYEHVVLRDEYLMRGEERARIQWKVKTEQLRKLLEDVGQRFTAPRDQTTLERIQKRFKETVLLFSQLTGPSEKTEWVETRRQEIGQMIAGSYDLMNHLRSLRESASRKTDAARDRTTLLVVIFMVVVVMITIGNSAAINRILTKRIIKLREGIKILGSGHLDYSISVSGNDELAELAKIVNQMSERLRASHISMENLHREISERKRVEEDLRGSEERFRRLTENAQDLIYRMSLPEGRYEYVSPAASTILGYTPDELLNRSLLIQQIIHPDWQEYFQAQWGKLLMGDMPPTYEYQIIHKSGLVRWLNQRNILVRDEAGHAIAIEGIVTDITERKNYEDALLANKKDLQRLSVRLSEAEENERKQIARELHDMAGQNLTALILNLNIIRTLLPEEVDPGVSRRLENSLELVEETNRQIRSIMADLRPAILDLFGLLPALNWFGERLKETSDFEVVVESEESFPRLTATIETVVFRIAQEALVNAAKYSGVKQAVVRLKKNGSIRLTIEDRGCGFTHKGFQIGDQEGGWGLATMKERALALGGDLQVFSRPGAGTRIILELPLA